ncbi:MAG: histidine phosphatase family protein, partial [Alphaproteobacteria bacterium]|nr:histidine phosphatase family protein [Alphaproteobacteria bacterium]
MTTTLIIARHGNTFKAGETLTRVGARTDLPLVEEKRGKAIGKYLKNHKLIPDVVFSGPLKRHIQTAELAVSEMDSSLEIKINHTFIEIDYGPDENKSEADVIARIG